MKLLRYLLIVTIFLTASIGFAGESDSHGDLYRPLALSASQQMAEDATEIPADQGAVFVPALADPLSEPTWRLVKNGKTIASGPTGTRLVAPAGDYTVVVGVGADPNQGWSTEVTVDVGETHVVEPLWGGLRVEVVDESNIPFRGTYELIRLADRTAVGTGYGADTLQSETIQTWLLKPGVYRIVRTGETYRARTNFSTVEVPASGLVHFRLVLDPSTGNFRGAGVIDATELVVAESTGDQGKWTSRVLLGGAVSLSSSESVVGRANQDTLTGTIFFDAYGTYRDGPHLASGIFEIEEGLVRIDPADGKSLPTQRAQDRLRADVVYTFFKNERVGPYARFGLLTNLFASEVLATEDTSVAFNFLDGSRDVRNFAANDQYRTADALGSLRVREGGGLNIRLFRSLRATVNWRIGLGLRQSFFSGSFVQADDPSTPELDLYELDDLNEEGVETTFTASVHLGERLLWLTDLEIFGDFGELGDPTIDWRNTFSYRLTRFASLDYTLDVLDFPQISDETQVTQNLLLRFSWHIL